MWKTTTPTLIGHITNIQSDNWTANLLSSGKAPDVVRLGNEEILVGQPGSYVVVRSHGNTLLCMVIETWQDELPPDQTGERPIRQRIGLAPLGEIGDDMNFVRGVIHFPVTGAEVHVAEAEHLDSMFLTYERGAMKVGTLSSRNDVDVFLEPSVLFSRHLAILGQSGSGKSWTVTSLLQRVVETMPRAHVILLDLHGEYCWTDEDGQMHSAFPEESMRYIDARELEIPYWLLNYEALVELLVDRTDPHAPVQIAYLRDVLATLRKKSNPDLAGSDRLAVDSPVYFSLDELYRLFKEANEAYLDFGKTKGPLNGQFTEFLVKLQSRFNDSRYDFLLRPQNRTSSETLEDLLRDFVGLGNPKRPITIVDLSPIPSDVRPTVSAQIGRLAFEFNFWNPARRQFPILLVCEEAHAYIPRASDKRFDATRRSMERIAKEGRKYGVGLAVVSQRPNELSETVLAQCGNYICLRITNPDDQEYVRELVPEGERNLMSLLTTLRRGEALALGEAAPLPTRFMVQTPNPTPNSNDADFKTAWTSGPSDIEVDDIVARWREQRR
ncbi:MAG: helicase HerA-like domain-containing protein [Pseudomonadota bacterium]